ncbi:MAG: TolC family protein, partial [Chitinophagaceae bacterium]|nr:TolC family protein [Chitinophagaceae bacterium]
MRKYFLISCFLFCNFNIAAQAIDKKLNLEQVFEIVKKYHPIVKQSTLEIDISAAEILKARGAFDPYFQFQNGQKTFNGIDYYQYTQNRIELPTWYGVSVNAGWENLNGSRLNSDKTIGQTNYAGVAVPLLKNLIFDKRRAALQQAKIFKEMALVEQQIIVNDILLDAAEDYWNWVQQYQRLQIMKNNVAVNKQRLELVKKGWQIGERPAIDTTETLTQLQSFQLLEKEYELTFQNAGINLSYYLWVENDLPLVWDEEIYPVENADFKPSNTAFNYNVEELLDMASRWHPELKLVENKLDVLAIEKKLKFQELLPKLDAEYNFLGKGYNQFQNEAALFNNNYQYGLKFEMPLRLSQGRGAYKQAKLKIDQTQLEQNIKRQKIELKIKNYYNIFSTLKNQ